MTTAAYLNTLSSRDARLAFLNCCAAPAWIEAMLVRRPFADDAAVFEAADDAASSLTESDWLEAFAAHPVIGDVDSLRQKYASTRQLAAGEQSGVSGASDATLAELARLNVSYRDKYGFIFIVFATGKSADEMLALLRVRIDNSREEELENAAAEQLKITRLRLQKLASAV